LLKSMNENIFSLSGSISLMSVDARR
jgi:hypothetical protein